MKADSKRLGRRAFFAAGAGVLGAAVIAVTSRSIAGVTDAQAYASPVDPSHYRGKLTCPCPICSGSAPSGRTANA